MTGQIQRGGELATMLRHLNTFRLPIPLGYDWPTVMHIGGDGDFFLTLAAARFKRAGHLLEFAGAGHPPAMILQPGERPRLLKSQSGVLGLLDNAVDSRPTVEVPMRAGDRIVLYTDGLTEAFNAEQEMLGVEGLSEIVREASTRPLLDMKQHILDRVAAWRAGPPADDISLVVVGML
jgi:serine phosphatase RsbU (regulator of sigma subunit)